MKHTHVLHRAHCLPPALSISLSPSPPPPKKKNIPYCGISYICRGGGAGGRGGEKSGALMWAAEGIYVTCGMAAGREGVLLVYAVIRKKIWKKIKKILVWLRVSRTA